MPGAKRKYDEDTWIVTQSKKFKCGQLLENVFASTLAQLRLGSRNFFKGKEELEGQNNSASLTPPRSPEGFPSPSSPLVRDVLSDNDINTFPQRPRELCQSCSRKTEGWGKCYYCEQLVCHVNSCQNGCNQEYCNNCCITKYDNPCEETYVCYSCLH